MAVTVFGTAFGAMPKSKDGEERLQLSKKERSELSFQLAIFLGGFVLLGLLGADAVPIDDKAGAAIITVQLVAFGLFVGCAQLYVLGMQAERERLVLFAALMQHAGLGLILAAAAMTARIQLYDEYSLHWYIGFSLMAVFAAAPALGDIMCAFIVHRRLNLAKKESQEAQKNSKTARQAAALAKAYAAEAVEAATAAESAAQNADAIAEETNEATRMDAFGQEQ